ncbi:BTB-domain-containing protein [Rhizophagus irregularis]|uniref:BTB-domain-containing protein n=1 Tax=Rhizophagus irregularis TaxID=588596 RepID=A0A2N1MEW5_9GLOM|nr:BTB-domain-containing protein [Rhizophagus irregularis]
MTRGYSLEQDLRFLINNPKYSDIEILCEDEKKLYGCRVILAARSEVFERLLYNGIKKSYETQIFFPKINSTEMEIVLEYIYTGSVKEESLTKDNIIETFYVADYFQLLNLQGFIMKTFKNILKKNYTEDYSPELLSKFVERMPLMVNRIYSVFLNLLVEAVANIPLNTIEFGRLSIAGLQYLLSCTYEKEKHFTTREYEVFRYSAILHQQDRFLDDSGPRISGRFLNKILKVKLQIGIELLDSMIVSFATFVAKYWTLGRQNGSISVNFEICKMFDFWEFEIRKTVSVCL